MSLTFRLRQKFSRVLRRVTESDYKALSQARQAWLRALLIGTVIDVGAHKGESALWYRKTLPGAKIFSFEPQPECYSELVSRLQGDANFCAFNVALGEQNDRLSFHKSSYTPSSSLLDMGNLHKRLYPGSATITQAAVEVRRLDDILSGLELPPPILLKLDTQGYEKHVLNGAAQLLNQVSVIITETLFQNLYQEQSSFDDVYSILRPYGFRLQGVWSEGRYNRENGLPLFSDLLFTKGETTAAPDVKKAL